MVKASYLTESETQIGYIKEQEYKRRRILANLDRQIERTKYCTKEQSIVLKEYLNHLLNRSRIKSVLSIDNEIGILLRFARDIKVPFSSLTKKKFEEWIAYLKRKNLKHNTINGYKDRIKRFLIWVGKEDIVEDVVIVKMEEKVIDPENDLLNQREILRMVNSCVTEVTSKTNNNPADTRIRDQFALMFGAETGARAGEVVSPDIKDVTDKGSHFIVTIRGKTGERLIALVDTAPYLRKWLEIHPFSHDKNAPLIISMNTNEFGRRLRESGYYRLVKKAGQRANIQKNVYPHLFRHSRATYLACVKSWTEIQLRKWFGWDKHSDMPSRYVHLGKNTAIEKYLTEHGIEVKKHQEQQEQEKLLNVKICSRCGHKNPPTDIYCKCGLPLDYEKLQEEKQKIDETDVMMKEILSDPELKDMFKQILAKKLSRE